MLSDLLIVSVSGFLDNITGSLSYNIKVLKVTVVVTYSYISKTELIFSLRRLNKLTYMTVKKAQQYV